MFPPSSFTLFFSLVAFTYGNIVVTNGTSYGEVITIDSTPLIFGGNSLDFSPINNASLSLINAPVKGSVVYIPLKEVSTENLLRAMDAGAIAIIYSRSPFFGNIGCEMYFNYARSLYRVSVPIVEISDADGKGVLNNNVTVTITSTHNECHALFTSVGFILVQCVVSGLCVVALCLCFFRLYQFYKLDQLFTLSLAVVAIFIEIIANIVKIIYIINFLGTNLLYSPEFDDFILYLSFPLSTITNIMITMFWHEALVSKGLEIHLFLKSKKFLITFIAMSAFLIGLELLVATLRLVINNPTKAVLLLPQVLGIIVNFGTLVYGVVILVRVFERAGGFKYGTENSILRNIIWRLTTNSIILGVFIISLIVLTVPPSFNLIKAIYAFGASYSAQSLLSILQVYSFQPRSLKIRTGTSSISIHDKSKTGSIQIKDKEESTETA